MTRSEVIQLRVSPEEREQMDALAEKAGVRLSEWVRSRALDLPWPGFEEPMIPDPPSPVDVEPALVPEPPVERPRLRCRVAGCDFAPKSPNAICPSHGGKPRLV